MHQDDSKYLDHVMRQQSAQLDELVRQVQTLANCVKSLSMAVMALNDRLCILETSFHMEDVGDRRMLN